MAGQSNACIATSCLLDQFVQGLCRLLLAANMAATRQWFAIMFGMLLLTSSSATELSLLFELLTQIGSGTGSVEAIGRIVRATDRGAPQRHCSIQGLAHLDRNHLERDLHRWVRRQAWSSLVPKTYTFRLLVNGEDDTPQEAMHSALLPHEVFGAVWQAAPELFEQLFTGTAEQLRKWWAEAAAAGDSWHADHPVVLAVPEPCMRVPIGLHGDDAGMHGQQPVLVLTWGSVAVQLPTLDSRIVFSCIRLSQILKDERDSTMQTLYKVLVWSLTAMSLGTYPAQDHDGRAFGPDHHPSRMRLAGRPLADGRVGAWAELRGDWKFLREALHLQQSYLHKYVCHLCRAHRSIHRLLFTSFSRNARHRCTLVDNRTWLAWHLAAPVVCPLLLVPGFHIWRVCFDIMHTLDLGVYQVVVPSAFWELTSSSRVWPGRSRQARFTRAYLVYKLWAKRRRVKAVVRKRFDARQWRKSATSYPRITQVVAKAAALRSMVYWLAEICTKHAHDEHDHLVSAMLSSFVAADVVCREAGRHFTAHQKAEFGKCIENALLANNALASEAAEQGRRLWKLLPKHHALTHIAFDFELNPRRVQCYADEDMVGRAKRLYVRCHGGTAPEKCLLRYSILLGARWWDNLRELRGIPPE